MEELFASGRIIDVIVALMALEAFVLILLRKKTDRGPTRTEILVSLAAGLALLVALRIALVDGRWEMISAALAASLVAHLADLRLRWIRAAPSSPVGSTHERAG